MHGATSPAFNEVVEPEPEPAIADEAEAEAESDEIAETKMWRIASRCSSKIIVVIAFCGWERGERGGGGHAWHPSP